MAIKARTQKTLTKIFDGSGVFSIIATNENTSIPISNQGLPLNYSSTPTDVYVYSGTSLLTPVASNPEAGQFTLTASGENISAGLVTVNGNHASLANASNMSVGKDSYSITLTASGKDFLGNPFSAQKKQVITPLKRGDDATSYWENVSSSVITKDVKGNMTPDSTTVSAVYQSGMADPDSYSGIFKVYLKSGVNFSTTPDYTSSAPEQLYKITPKSDTNDIKVELYDATGTNLLDIQTVPVISQANGVISTKIVYTVTSSQVQPNDSANWSDTIPTVGKGQYLWTKTTFYYTDGSNAVAYSMGSNGKDGSSAALLTLTADSQIVTFDSDGSTPIPAAQTITLTAILQNLTGTATFVATPYSGDAAGTPITLGGTGNVRTITASQFGSQYDSVSVKATLGELSDTETIHKLTKGENGDPGPKGADGTDGKNGTDGAPGPKGADGRTSYVHVAYANSADGTSGFSTTDATGKSYVGVYTDFTAADSTTPSVYTWSLIKGSDGKDGSDGIQGPKGADGISTYVHFAYANSSDGKTNFSVTDPTGRAYVGTLTDTTIADSTDPTKYTWSLIKGADGTDGKNGVNSYSGWLTNESITLQADSNGNVPSFTSATGSFIVYNGLTQVTGLTVTQANASGITVSITGMNYSVTEMSSDNGYVDLSITTNGITIIKRLTVAKSKAGATGANGTSVVNSTTPPSNPAEGQWWNDLSVTPNILKVYQKGNWIPYRIDAINLVAGSVKADNLAADVLLASNVKYTNSNGTTTNLQTFDFDGIKTLLSDSNGNTYSSMDTAVSSTKSWTSLSKQVNSLGQINQLFNTEWSPDFAGWYAGNSATSGAYVQSHTLSASDGWSMSSEKYNGSNVINFAVGNVASFYSDLIPAGASTPVSVSMSAKSSSDYTGTVTLAFYLRYYDANKNYISQKAWNSNKVTSWSTFTLTDTTPANTAYIVFNILTNGGAGTNSYSQPMMVFSQTVGDYVQGNYNNNARVLAIEARADKFDISIKGAQDSADTANSSATSAQNTANTANSNAGKAQISADSANSQLSSMALPNLFPNSDFDTDYGYRKKDGNTVLSLATKNNIDGAYNGTVSVTSTGAGYQGYWTNNIQVQGGQKYSASVKVHYTNGGLAAGKALLDLWFIDSNGARISSASATTSQVSSPYWVQLVSEGFTAPTNAVYLQMSLLVNNAGAGQVATFTQPVLVASSKLLNYTPNDDISTTLKLTADNYTLGIDANGNLVSGITGNTKSVTIKGNAITLDGNTNVTGDFYALGGNFKNLNAANLVGTNASFFQANFANAYGQSVSIDGSGMVVSYSDRFTTFDGDGVKYKQLVNYSDGTSGIETIGSFITSYKGTVNSLMMNVYDQTYNNIGSPVGETWGGDMLGWSRAADHNGNLNSLFTWSNGTAASNMNTSFGFNFYDRINFNQNEIVSGGNFNFLMSSTKFGNGYFGGKSVPSITATWSGNTGGGIAFGNDNVIIFAPGKTKIIL